MPAVCSVQLIILQSLIQSSCDWSLIIHELADTRHALWSSPVRLRNDHLKQSFHVIQMIPRRPKPNAVSRTYACVGWYYKTALTSSFSVMYMYMGLSTMLYLTWMETFRPISMKSGTEGSSKLQKYVSKHWPQTSALHSDRQNLPKWVLIIRIDLSSEDDEFWFVTSLIACAQNEFFLIFRPHDDSREALLFALSFLTLDLQSPGRPTARPVDNSTFNIYIRGLVIG